MSVSLNGLISLYLFCNLLDFLTSLLSFSLIYRQILIIVLLSFRRLLTSNQIKIYFAHMRLSLNLTKPSQIFQIYDLGKWGLRSNKMTTLKFVKDFLMMVLKAKNIEPVQISDKTRIQLIITETHVAWAKPRLLLWRICLHIQIWKWLLNISYSTKLSTIHYTLSSNYPWCRLVILWQLKNILSTNPK